MADPAGLCEEGGLIEIEIEEAHTYLGAAEQ
jgi:hypothetical protein